MKRKIYIRLCAIGIISIILTAVCTVLIYYGMFKKNTMTNVRNTVIVLSDVMNNKDVQLDVIKKVNGRITLIDTDGTVLYDNSADYRVMENHIDRPEVKEALEYGTGTSVHSSATLGYNSYYCAVKLNDGRILRYSESAKSALSIYMSNLPILLVITSVILLMCVIFANYLTKQIIKPVNNMSENLDDENLEATYDELTPFVKAIRERNKRIGHEITNLMNEKKKIETVIENMSEGMLLLDKDLNVISVNDGAVNIMNGKKECIGRNLLYFSRNEYLNNVIHYALCGKRNTVQTEINKRYIDIIGSPIKDGNNITGVICLIMDVTEKRESEKMRSEFTANVSHELKTPLTSISGYSEMIENGMVKEEDIKGFAAKIHSEALRLLDLIGDIIKLSELETEKESNRTDVDIHETVKQCMQRLTVLASQKNVELNINCIENFTYSADIADIEHIICNICDNAVRYNKPGGKVTVTISRGKVSVKDTGIGIPKEHQLRIFERFYRVDKSRSKETGGTGLGLAIVKHAAKKAGVTVDLKSSVDTGTEVIIYFKDE